MPLEAKLCCISLFHSKTLIVHPWPLVFKDCCLRVSPFPHLVVVVVVMVGCVRVCVCWLVLTTFCFRN